MINSEWLFAACCIFALLVTGVQGAIYSADNSAIVSIKYNNGEPTISESFMRLVTGKSQAGEFEIETAPVNPEKEMINVISIEKNGEVKKHNIQTPTVSNIYVSQTVTDDTDVMQTTNEPGYPVLEIYWGYDKSPGEPWRYYARVNNAEDGYAVYSDFRTKSVWTNPITMVRVNEIINSGTIPAWGTI